MKDGAQILSEFIDGELGIKPKKSANTKKHPLLEFIDKEIEYSLGILEESASSLGGPEAEANLTALGHKPPAGTAGATVYETCALIVAKLDGDRTLPTIEEINSLANEHESVDMISKGAQWMQKVLNDPEAHDALPPFIQWVGGDIKKLPPVKKWGTGLSLINASIGDYYSAIANHTDAEKLNFTKSERKDIKPNTADMVIVTKGTRGDLLTALAENKSVEANEKTGVVTVGGDIEFIQVSLKKSKKGARIGKLSRTFNDYLGQLSVTPEQLMKTAGLDMSLGRMRDKDAALAIFIAAIAYAAGDIEKQDKLSANADQLGAWMRETHGDNWWKLSEEELMASGDMYYDQEIAGGLNEGAFADFAKKGLGFIKSAYEKVKEFISGLAKKVWGAGQSAATEAGGTEMNEAGDKLFHLLQSMEGAENLSEGERTQITVELYEQVKKLSEVMLSPKNKGQFEKERKMMIEKIDAINGLSDGSDLVRFIDGNSEFSEDNIAAFRKSAEALLEYMDKTTDVGKEDYDEPAKGRPRMERVIEKTLLTNCVKLCTNFASFQTLNQMLQQILNSSTTAEEARSALVQTSVDTIADAKFGNTKLPLFIAYGTGDGVWGPQTVEQYKESSKKDIEKGKFDKYPLMEIQVGKSSAKMLDGSEPNYNAFYASMMTGARMNEKTQSLEPVYLKLQFINRLANFSYKIEGMAEETASKFKINPYS